MLDTRTRTEREEISIEVTPHADSTGTAWPSGRVRNKTGISTSCGAGRQVDFYRRRRTSFNYSINHLKPDMMKTMKTLALSTLLVALCGTSISAVAQDAPKFDYVTQTTTKFVVPEGATRADMQATFQEYYDKVIAKSTLIKHYALLIHAWGSLGGSYVTTTEFANWEDIDKVGDELDAPANTARPDAPKRTAFLKKLGSYSYHNHSDEIYTVIKSMQK